MGMVRVCDMLLVHNQAIRSFREVMKRGELVRRYSREEENRQLEKPHLTLKDF
jgi:hypothetical protein